MAVAREQAHALTVALNDQPVTVVLNFVDPLGPVRVFGSAARDAGFEQGFGHGEKIGDGVKNADRNLEVPALVLARADEVIE